MIFGNKLGFILKTSLLLLSKESLKYDKKCIYYIMPEMKDIKVFRKVRVIAFHANVMTRV